MAVRDADAAEGSVRQWIQSKFGTPGENVYFESVRREASAWTVDVQFIISGYRKYYNVLVDTETGAVTGYTERFRPFTFPNVPPHLTPSRGTAGVLMLAALIVSIIVVIVFIAYSLSNLLTGIFSIYPFGLAGVGRIIAGVFLLAFGIIDIYITSEINNIRDLLERGDVSGAIARNSIALGVAAVVLDGVVPGILLLIAREEMSSLQRQPSAG